jgi:hypothetical protein
MVQTFTWIDPDGAQTPLTISWDINGRFMPPVTFISDKLPNYDGDVPRHVRHEARLLKITGFLQAACQSTDPIADVYAQLVHLVTAMNPKRGIGTLRVMNAAGQQRDLKCYYTSGLELPEQFGSSAARRVHKIDLVFTAFDPYWTGTSTTVLDFPSGAAVNFFPFFPLRLTTSQIVVSQLIVTDATVETWPIWKLFGPGGTIILTNLDTGEKTELTNGAGVTISTGDYIIIDTRPGIKTITRASDGANLWPFMTPDSTLWSIPPGGAYLELQMTGTSPGLSVLELTYVPRYLTI